MTATHRMTGRDATPWLIVLVVAGAALLAILLIAPEGGPGEVDHPDSNVGGPPVSTTGSAIAAVQTIGGRADLDEMVGQRLELIIDIGQAVNDVACVRGRLAPRPNDDGGRSARRSACALVLPSCHRHYRFSCRVR